MDPAPPSPRVRLTGRAVNALVARAPALWPLLRTLMRGFWDREAATWNERIDRSSADYLAPLGAALLHVPEPERALEIGTGLGDGALLIAREFPSARVRGIDISEEMIRRATDRIGLDPSGRIAFRVGDAASLPYEDDSFDLVAQLNVPPFLAETARVLRPGGAFAIAASWGPATPFYTPEPVLRRGCERHGLVPSESGESGRGTFFVARAPGANPG
jgi:SAM-dependent methyltransferase